MRLHMITTHRWMVLMGVFAVTLTGSIVFQRWVTAKVTSSLEPFRKHAGLPPGSPLDDFVIPLPKEVAE
jgi:hypothetical protein